MAALISLERAKDHLRITTDDANGDIQSKAEQASAIIIDYLKIRSIAIASISAANPTVITTTVPHSLITGTTYTVAGTTTTPTVNGAQIVTVTGPTTFTVPVNVTIGQATEAGTVGTPAWTDANVPLQIQRAVEVMLTHLHEHRGDDMAADEATWKAIERILCRSRDPALA